MSVVRKNIVANLIGSIWLSLIGFIFIPYYVKFLGVAAWGLIGIFSTLQVVFALLDLGLSSTLNREMARLSEFKGNDQVMRNMVRTLEFVYWSMAILIGFSFLFLSPLIAKHWINSVELSTSIVTQSLLIMGVIIALQMPIGLYSGGLMGLQRQVTLNTINIVISTLRSIGVILILWLVSPTIQAFFLWQIFTSILNVLLLIYFLWRNLPSGQNKPTFQKDLIKSIWRFAAGMSGISILGIILTELDKVVLTKLITLNDFGYYMLANTISMIIGRLISPLFYSFYPRFTQLAASANELALQEFYHKICQLVSVLILPIAAVLVFFSYDIMLLWTKNLVIAEKTYIIMGILVSGSAINAIMYPPYALQLAYGWTRLSIFKNIIAIIIFIPVIILLSKTYGPIGAASAWVMINLGYFIFEIRFMHFRLLKNEKIKWYLNDVLYPLFIIFLIVGISKLIMGDSHFPPLLLGSILVVILSATVGITALMTPLTRKMIFQTLAKQRLTSKFFSNE